MDLKMNEAFILDAPHIDQIGESMERTCRALGFETISMRDEFETIYKTDAVKTAFAQGQAA